MSIDKKMAMKLAGKFWAQCNANSDYEEVDGLEYIVAIKDGKGKVVFSPRPIYFDGRGEKLTSIEVSDMDKRNEKPGYTLLADYSDALDLLAVWSLDDQTGDE